VPRRRKSPPTSRPPVTIPLGIQFTGLLTRMVSFTELPPPEGGAEPLAPGARADVQLQFTVGISRGETEDATIGEVTLDTSATPDPKHQPYLVRIIMTGVFQAPRVLSAEGFDEFCKRGAPVIIWPYVRAMMSFLTADGRFGTMRLDPVNLSGFLRRDESTKTKTAK
jgi:preprotein translocase subunit SecB